MHGTTIAGAAMAGFLVDLLLRQSSATLLTIPQRDGLRTRRGAAQATVSADGRYIALTSYARLAPADTDDRPDVYVLDQATGQVSLESLTADGRSLGGNSAYPRLSGDGRYLVFETAILGTDGARPEFDIVIRDRVQDTARCLSPRLSADASRRWKGRPTISDDGGTIVFLSTDADLTAGSADRGSVQDVYLFQIATGEIQRLNVDRRGFDAPRGLSFAPSVSADGRFVAFASTADLVGARDGRDAPLQRSRRSFAHIYVRDTERNLTRRASMSSAGRAPDGASTDPVISRDGLFVAFVSDATNLVPGDRNRSADIFLHEVTTGSTTLVSRSVTGGAANGASAHPAISADGRFVAFQSDASDLVCARRCPTAVEDINLLSDVFLFDRITGVTTLISTGAGGGWMEESGAPAIDASGDVVAFTSRHPIDERDVANDFDLFVRVGRWWRSIPPALLPAVPPLAERIR